MYLIFTDESGTNKDSSLVLYGGLAVQENNLIKAEIIIFEIVEEYFGIKNLLDDEIHFVDVFNFIFFSKLPSRKTKRDKFERKFIPLIKEKNLTKSKLSEFVSELFQFLNKVNAYYIFSFLEKKDLKENEALGYVFKVFLNLADHFLNEKGENGVLVADGFYSQRNKKNTKINIFSEDFEFDKFSGNQKELLFKRILFESQDWKYKVNTKDHFPLKYKFESKIFNLHSNVFFISSDESVLIQISDIFLYVIKKYLEFTRMNENNYLKEFFTKDLISTIEFVYSRSNLKCGVLDENYDILTLDNMPTFKSIVSYLRQVG